ncbi:MAG: dipicolinate synthase subunit B [Bacillaceae bacterium]|nr:dipicolinate synthase subunit B [Bacillaceae bacterium]
MDVYGKRIGFGLTGSHCTYEEVIPQIRKLRESGAEVVPVVTYTVARVDSKFGEARKWLEAIKEAAGTDQIIASIPEAEPLGPKHPLDCMVIAPSTGASTSKLANAITDNPVLMAAKATMRNQRPVVVAISTNDGLGLNMANIAKLMAAKNIYMVPFGQDNPEKKQNSLVSHMDLIKETVEAALEGKQLQPVIIEKYKYS